MAVCEHNYASGMCPICAEAELITMTQRAESAEARVAASDKAMERVANWCGHHGPTCRGYDQRRGEDENGPFAVFDEGKCTCGVRACRELIWEPHLAEHNRTVTWNQYLNSPYTRAERAEWRAEAAEARCAKSEQELKLTGGGAVTEDGWFAMCDRYNNLRDELTTAVARCATLEAEKNWFIAMLKKANAGTRPTHGGPCGYCGQPVDSQTLVEYHASDCPFFGLEAPTQEPQG